MIMTEKSVLSEWNKRSFTAQMIIKIIRYDIVLWMLLHIPAVWPAQVCCKVMLLKQMLAQLNTLVHLHFKIFYKVNKKIELLK